jgi:hypothetical protein
MKTVKNDQTKKSKKPAAALGATPGTVAKRPFKKPSSVRLRDDVVNSTSFAKSQVEVRKCPSIIVTPKPGDTLQPLS